MKYIYILNADAGVVTHSEAEQVSQLNLHFKTSF